MVELDRLRKSQKRYEVQVNAWASWGAAVLRPYKTCLMVEGPVVLTSEILRFAQDDGSRKAQDDGSRKAQDDRSRKGVRKLKKLGTRRDHWLS
jgi:hypothetical protein